MSKHIDLAAAFLCAVGIGIMAVKKEWSAFGYACIALVAHLRLWALLK